MLKKSLQICCLCGEEKADTCEHKFKRYALAEIAFDQSKEPAYWFNTEGDQKRIQGPKSEHLKYGKIICATCNNDRTQPFDQAYDKMVDWCRKNSMNSGLEMINFKEVFGENVFDGHERLLKFLIKKMCCELISNGHVLPDYFPNVIKGTNIDKFKVSICRVDPTFGNIPSLFGANILYHTPMLGHISRKKVLSALWAENLVNFQINYWFNIEPDPYFGIPLSMGEVEYPLVNIQLTHKKMLEKMESVDRTPHFFGT